MAVIGGCDWDVLVPEVTWKLGRCCTYYLVLGHAQERVKWSFSRGLKNLKSRRSATCNQVTKQAPAVVWNEGLHGKCLTDDYILITLLRCGS